MLYKLGGSMHTPVMSNYRCLFLLLYSTLRCISMVLTIMPMVTSGDFKTALAGIQTKTVCLRILSSISKIFIKFIP